MNADSYHMNADGYHMNAVSSQKTPDHINIKIKYTRNLCILPFSHAYQTKKIREKKFRALLYVWPVQHLYSSPIFVLYKSSFQYPYSVFHNSACYLLLFGNDFYPFTSIDVWQLEKSITLACISLSFNLQIKSSIVLQKEKLKDSNISISFVLKYQQYQNYLCRISQSSLHTSHC